MPNRKIAVAIFTILFSTILLFSTTNSIAEASDDKYKDLIGEWSGVWPGQRMDRSTVVVHEIDEANSKARITYIIDLLDEGHKEYAIMADFSPGRRPELKFNTRGNDFTCVLKTRSQKLEVSFVGTSQTGVPMSNSCLMEKRLQIISQIEELLKKNPLPEGQKSQEIKISENDNASISLIRSVEGAGLKPYFQATHDETMYIVKGTGQLLVNDKWVDLKPGIIHFNPVGKTHAYKQIGAEPLVFISIFTPGMKDPDRQFVE
jgi:mannose-6-phosphate isomerase-like protein (cupin superfamily)